MARRSELFVGLNPEALHIRRDLPRLILRGVFECIRRISPICGDRRKRECPRQSADCDDAAENLADTARQRCKWD